MHIDQETGALWLVVARTTGLDWQAGCAHIAGCAATDLQAYGQRLRDLGGFDEDAVADQVDPQRVYDLDYDDESNPVTLALRERLRFLAQLDLLTLTDDLTQPNGLHRGVVGGYQLQVVPAPDPADSQPSAVYHRLRILHLIPGLLAALGALDPARYALPAPDAATLVAPAGYGQPRLEVPEGFWPPPNPDGRLIVPLQINGVWHELVALPALTDATQELAVVDVDDRAVAALDRPGQLAAVTCRRGTVQIRGRAYVLVTTPTC